MKRFLKVSSLIIVILLSINIVQAEECENLKMYAKSDFSTFGDVVMKYGSNDSNYYIHKLKDGLGSTFSAYCRNAGIWGGKSREETQVEFSCDHTVFDATSEDEATRTYDAGIIAILKNGYSTRNPNPTTLTTDREYAATNVALRVYEMFWPDLNTNGGNGENLHKAHQYYVNLWLDDAQIQKLLKETVGKIRSKFDDAITVNSWKENGIVITSEIENEAKRLVILGLEAAKYYKQNGAASLKGVDQKPYKEKEAVSTDSNGNKTYKTSLTYTFEADKFKSKDAYIKINFGCSECSKYGVNYTLYINDEEVNQNISNINLVKYLKNGNGTIEFKIVFSGSSNTYHCEELNYTLNLEWFDETISVEAYNMHRKGCTSTSACQNFYVLYATDVSTKKTINNSIELCSLSCKEAETSCRAGNSDACQIFNKKYGGNCAECTTYINNAACSSEDSNININEGYDVDTANCGNVTEDNNLNVLQCIINNEDAAGNSYKATNLLSNEFCSVFCKEDYQFTLPGIKEVNSGRYFSLKASVKGAKTCYTSKIDEDGTFNSQLEAARQKVIDAWNEWNKWYTGSNTQTDSEDKTVTACCNGGTYYYTNYFRKWKYLQYSLDGSNYYDTEELRSNGSSSCSCHKVKETYTKTDGTTGTRRVCGSGSCTTKNGKSSDIENNINSNLSSAESTLKSAINTYTSIINRYNSCSGVNTVSYNIKLNSSNTNGWKMSYKYDPKISFWYEESYMNSILKDELETISESVNIGSMTQQVCTSDTNNSYKSCSSGWQSSISKNDTTSQFVCKQNGSVYTCGYENIIISKAKYVKQEMTSSSEHITPTQFYTIYSTGAIVAAEAGNKNNIENSSELTNKLPVGLGTTQGVYTYALKVSNLGEYYNNSKLGRIWGSKNSVVVKVLEDAEEGNSCTKEGALKEAVKVDKTTISNGVYVCAYKVNCPDCPVECDPTCKNPDCPDGSCPVECDNCIYTNNSANISYKPISPGNINPNDREMGINWKYDKNSISTALELKAYATTQEIEELGETIYDVNYEDTLNSDAEFAMHIKLDTKLINKIRTYNDKYENNGGYANNTLKCYDHVNSNDGKTYSNIYCYSTFIDELLCDSNTKDNIKIIGDRRKIADNCDEEDTDRLRKNETQTSGYWTTWSEANTNKWKITTEKGIAYYKQNYSEIGIGPSWK